MPLDLVRGANPWLNQLSAIRNAVCLDDSSRPMTLDIVTPFFPALEIESMPPLVKAPPEIAESNAARISATREASP